VQPFTFLFHAMNTKAELKTILLVEDSENDIEMTLEALEEYSVANKIDIARDGAEAVDYLFRRNQYASRPDFEPVVVLLDVKLPKLNGIEVLRAIRSAPQFARLPVVMVTSSREEPDLRTSYDLGCNAYVVKPVDFKQFSEALRIVGCFWALLNEQP
jgi:CheY-like chemotaxis protein